MALLIMNDGARRTVSDKDARIVWSIKRGFRKPSSPKQARFVKAIQEVRFDGELPTRRPVMGVVPRKITDAKVQEIIHDSRLTGHAKMQQIGNAIRERHHLPPIGGVKKEHDLQYAWVPDGLTLDSRKRYLQVRYCANCFVAIPMFLTTAPREKAIRRAQLRITTGDIGKFCGATA